MGGEGGVDSQPGPGTPASRVHAGAELLDRAAPGWYRHVPVSLLDMSTEGADVLALLAQAGVTVPDLVTGPDEEALGRWLAWEIGIQVGQGAGMADIHSICSGIGQLAEGVSRD